MLLSLNPATGRRIRRHRVHSASERAAILDEVTQAQSAWRRVPLVQRARHLRALAARLDAEIDTLAAEMVMEMGKPIIQARAEIEKCAAACRHYARHAAGYLKPEHPPGSPCGSEVVFQPLGLVLGIMPWNFPFWQTFRAAAPALMAGNGFILKHASNVSGCALAIESLCARAGLPPGLLRTVLCGSDAVPALIADDRIHAVTLTGSTAAGREVGALAGRALKPCVLELGGSDPYLVLEDADLVLAARICATARLINSGQSCIAAKRFIVVNSVRKEFESRLVAEFASRQMSDPMDSATDIGPLARDDLRAELHRQVRRSLRAGARLLAGGTLPKGPGFFYPPTILSGVTPGMPAHDEELFGPVAAIIAARHEADAVARANASAFGLGAAVFTRHRRRGRSLAIERLEAGTVFVNDFVRSDPSLPFGGIKTSGFGRELGSQGIRAFVNIKTVCSG